MARPAARTLGPRAPGTRRAGRGGRWGVGCAIAVVMVVGCEGRDRRGHAPAVRGATSGETAEAPGTRTASVRGDHAEHAIEPPARPLTDAGAKLHRARLTFAMVDPALQSIRISFRPQGDQRWRWPSWLSVDEAQRLVAEIAELGTLAPALPALDRALVSYAAQVGADVATLDRAVRAWGQAEVEDGSVDPARARPAPGELHELFERLGHASQAVHRAANAAQLDDDGGSLVQLERVCLRAVESLSFLPTAAPTAESLVRGQGTAFPGVATAEVAARARACADAALDHLASSDADSYGAQLGVSLAMSMFREVEGLRRRRSYVSASSNAAQQIGYLAERGARRVGRARRK